MTEIIKTLNKENLKYYIEKMLNDKEFRKEVGENCICMDFNVAVADPHAEECYINTVFVSISAGELSEEFEKTFNRYIPEQGSIIDFVENCQQLKIDLEGKDEYICVNYKKHKECK